MLPSFQYNKKCSQSDLSNYTVTLSTFNTLNTTEFIPEKFHHHSDPTSKDIGSWTHNEICSDVKHVYFIVPPEDVHFTGSDVKISANISSVVTPENQPSLLANESINFDKISDGNNSDSIYVGLFDYKLSTPSEIVIEKNLLVNEIKEGNVLEKSNISSFDDRLSKRESLLPGKGCCKSNKRKIKCDKCKAELNSASQYYSHRNIHMQDDDKLSWFCAQCGEKLKCRNALKSHELQKHGEIRMYPCPYCVYSSRKLLLLEYHIRNIHHGERKFKCKLCSKKFFRVHDLKMHLNIHLALKCYICHLCGRQFNHSSNLIRHMRVHTKVRPYSCQVCDRRFSQLPSLLAHQISHTSGGKCPDCSAKYRSISGLKKHLKSIHKRKIGNKEISKIFYRNSENSFAKSRFFNCRICFERFRYKKGLKIHENTFHSNSAIPCRNCFKIFPTNQDFKSHACLRLNNVDQPESNSSIYKCSSCFKSCKSFEEAESHICETHLGNNISSSSKLNDIGITIIPEVNDNSDDLVVLYFNSVDNVLLSSGPDLYTNVRKNTSTVDQVEKEHIPLVKEKVILNSAAKKLSSRPKLESWKESKIKDKNFSQNLIQSKISNADGIVLYKCKYCSKEFTKMWNWSQHMGTHDSSMQKYTCQQCMKSFSYRSTYTNHLKMHASSTDNTNEVFSCSQCFKTYKSKGALSHHIKRLHEKKENYFCQECSKGFYFKSAYNYHIRLHKNEQIYVCCFCGRKFSHSSHLRRHERMHTGERPHKCPHCPKSFIQPVTLRTHLRKHQDLASNLNSTEGKVGKYIDVSSAQVVVDATDGGESQKDFAVINLLEEMTDLAPYNPNVPDEFASYVIQRSLM